MTASHHQRLAALNRHCPARLRCTCPTNPGKKAEGVPRAGKSARSWRKSPPQFKLAMRGYDPDEVEAFLAQLSDDPQLPVPGFARVMRGYDPEQVDLHIQQVKALGQPPSST
jgi:DivIVA domain-containing protein